MEEVTADNLKNYVRTNNEEEFKKHILQFITEGNILDFISKCKKEDIKLAVDWCKKVNIDLIHKLFERIENIDHISFLDKLDKLDSEKRTWLHIAVIHDRNLDILNHLIDVHGINIDCKDDYDYTALHYYCQKEEYDIDVLTLLMRDQSHLTKQSKDGLTPLEFACTNQANLEVIRSMPKVDMKGLLRKIDNISDGVMEIEQYTLTTAFPTDRIWLNLLQKNDKYLLMSYIKNDENFLDKYYLQPSDTLSIIKKCPENGQGILSYIKRRFFKGTTDPQLNRILSGLTGIKIKESSKKRIFYKSALFLALITGRFQLIAPLLRCCQFEIISYAMLICLICKKLSMDNLFPDQVIKDIMELKGFCEEYSITVMYSTYNKDLSQDKNVISNYINRKSEKLDSKTIVEVAYYAKCTKFLGLPVCQESLTKVWNERSFKCPRIKFWLHSLMHLAFLALFSFVVVNFLYAKVTFIECVCYAYGLGYLLEELRQIYITVKDNFLTSYAIDAANIIDIFALVFMTVGFFLRMGLSVPVSDKEDDNGLFVESKHTSLFVQRLFLCMSLIAFSMRVLYFASLYQILGPKLKMISTMISKDLIPLIFIFIVFMTSFGVTFQSLLYPNSFYTKEGIPGRNITFDKKNILSTVGDIFRRGVFTIFDFHYTLNDIENNQNDYVTDANGRYAVYFLLIIFMVVVNVMLMNLLIALFANTVTRIIVESKESWKSSRYAFINEYSDRTILPPPFNIIVIPIEVLIRSSLRKVKHQKLKRKSLVDPETVNFELIRKDNETPEEPSMSYYIYQAFAINGQRYRLMKDPRDLEYEKEVHFKNIEQKLTAVKLELKKAINEKCKTLENKIDSLLNKERQSVN